MNAHAGARPIGIFDSGMGGLTVMRELVARLPLESFVYLGDTARLPYGTKSAGTVVRYAVQAARLLTRYDVKLLVVACNTASAVALPALEEALAPIPVLGVLEPGAEAAVAAANGGPIAVLATEGTVQGGAYDGAIRRLAPQQAVIQQACPLFVALAEEGLHEGPIADLVADHYLAPLFAQARPEVLLLGCTHFPIFAETLAKCAGRNARRVSIVDSAATTAEAVAQLLERLGLARASRDGARNRFLATDSPARFVRAGTIFLGYAPDPVELVDLQDA